MKKIFFIFRKLIFALMIIWPGLSPAIFSAQALTFDQTALNSIQKVPVKIYSSLEEITRGSGQSVLLVFFSLSCQVCWDELFEMKEFIEKFSLPVIIIGVSADEREELQAFASRYSFPYPILQDKDKKLYRQFRVRLEPYRVVLYNQQPVYADDYRLDYQTRRDKAKQCLLNLSSK
ncbi:MAG: peroxiredoxin family protein [Candidatus Saccharicenans sp.]